MFYFYATRCTDGVLPFKVPMGLKYTSIYCNIQLYATLHVIEHPTKSLCAFPYDITLTTTYLNLIKSPSNISFFRVYL